MKKNYIAPVLDLVKFDINDIISHSNATVSGKPEVDIWDMFFDDSGDFKAN